MIIIPMITAFVAGGASYSIVSRLCKIRHQQKLALTKKTSIKRQMKAPEKHIAKHQYAAITAMVLSAVSLVTSPTVALFGLPFLTYNYLFFLWQAKKSFDKRKNNKHKISLTLLDFFSISAALLAGFFLASSLLFLTFFTAMRMIVQAEHEAHIDFKRIFGELADTVWLSKGGVEIETPLGEVKVDDLLIVRAGEMIPVDGEVVFGAGRVDQHLLTGESQPVDKSIGDEVLTSTLLVTGHLQVRVKRHGSETITGQIAQTLEHAATFKHHMQARSEKIVEQGATWTLLATAASLPFIGLSRAMSLTYSGFGYQMRMAAPLMVLNYLRIASNKGILIKDGRSLDTLQKIDTIVFDKTGTLTEGVPEIESVLACEGFSKNTLLQYAASAEQRQNHPVAIAIRQYATSQQIPILEVIDTDYAIGYGLNVTLDKGDNTELTLLIGSHRFMLDNDLDIPTAVAMMQTKADEVGYSVIYVAIHEQEVIGAITLRPAIRQETQATVNALKSLDMEIYIISGDQEKPTKHMADSLGINHYFAEVLPKDKADLVRKLQNSGKKVCFIGDGINDSVALQTADVSVSLHGAATIAQDTADILLINKNLLSIPYILKMSRELNNRMTNSEILNHLFGVTCVAGVIILGMGMGGAILLYSSGLLINISNAMIPVLKEVNLLNFNK